MDKSGFRLKTKCLISVNNQNVKYGEHCRKIHRTSLCSRKNVTKSASLKPIVSFLLRKCLHLSMKIMKRSWMISEANRIFKEEKIDINS